MAKLEITTNIIKSDYSDFTFIKHDESDFFVNLLQFIDDDEQRTLLKVTEFIVFSMNFKNKKFEILTWSALYHYGLNKVGTITFDELIQAVYKIYEHIRTNKKLYPDTFDKTKDYGRMLITMDYHAPKIIDRLELI